MQGMFFFVDVLDNIAEPFTVSGVVWMHPSTDSDSGVRFQGFKLALSCDILTYGGCGRLHSSSSTCWMRYAV